MPDADCISQATRGQMFHQETPQSMQATTSWAQMVNKQTLFASQPNGANHKVMGTGTRRPANTIL